MVTQGYILVGIAFSGKGSLSWQEWLSRALLIFIPMLCHQLIDRSGRARSRSRVRKASNPLNAGEGLKYLLNADRKEFIVFGCRLWLIPNMEKEFEDSLDQSKRFNPQAVLLSLGADIAHTATETLFQVRH